MGKDYCRKKQGEKRMSRNRETRGLTPITAEVIVVGAGAAGLMCAIEAGKRGRSVLVLERNDKPGRKIGISGGGRCNFTNIHTTAENFISGNKNFHRSALSGYTPADSIELVERHGIRYHEKKLGQLFCDGSSGEILKMLGRESEKAGVEVRLNCQLSSIRKKDRFLLESNLGSMTCESLVIASGGLSIPKIGATGFGHGIAKQFGLRVTELRPGLVPLTLERPWAELSGVSVEAEVRCGKTGFRENILFTHRGLSGPAILQISNYWKGKEPMTVNLLPDKQARELLVAERQTNKELKTVLGQYLPQRFVQQWCMRSASSRPMNRYSTLELEEIAQRLHRWEIHPADTEGYAKAEVTLGGVDTGELSSKTMESRRVPGLYFIGEVVDVTGWLGGYNFQWAWASGHAAGQFV